MPRILAAFAFTKEKDMNTSMKLPRQAARASWALAATVFLLFSLRVTVAQEAPQRDGQRDFDFLVGSWKIHLKRLVQANNGSKEWVELDGTVVCRQVFGGRAEVEEFNVESSDKKMHIEGLATRFYNPNSHQWSIWWANAKDGAMYPPPVVGEFKNGRGEFYDQEVVDGRVVFTRYVWTATTTKSPHFEQSISADGGKSWELTWVTDQTKVNP
jgi:hypothetical protein